MIEAHLDYETYSELDLTKVGGYRYAEHESTEILMASYYVAGWPSVRQWVPAEGEPMPDDLDELLRNEEVTFVAWNAAFERAITRCCLPGYDVPVRRWRCAMVDAMAVGLPGKLEHAGPASGLPEEMFKQEGGRKLINKFCKPRKPTKKNPDTRLTYLTAPEEWALFKQYNVQDTVAETGIWDKLVNWRLPPEEQDLWELDQAINDHGIRVDIELAKAAHEMGLMHRAKLVEKAQALTALENPNSVKQLIEWLNDQPDFDPDEDQEVEDLRKKTVEKILGRGDLGDVVRQVLELRQQIAKSSLKKYDVLLRATCDDGYIHGTMQFYGAMRTGRWAGRLLQVQNLPQGCIEDLELLRIVREVVRSRDYDFLVFMFGEEMIPAVLATLIRTCLIASEGNDLLAVDFSAIESVVTAWFADCKWRLDVFKTHGKIYEASAATAFGMDLEEILGYKKRTGKHHPIRKKGKVIELACLAGDTQVLTPRGYVALSEVSTDDKVWDGMQWVEHKGMVCRGEKETINLLGVRVTPDHLIKTGETWTPAETLASSGSTRSLALATGSVSLPYSDFFASAKEHATKTSSRYSVPAELSPTTSTCITSEKERAHGVTPVQKSRLDGGSRPISSMPIPAQTMHTVGAFLIGSAHASPVATPRELGNTATTVDGASTSSSLGGKTRELSSRIWSVSRAMTSLISSLTGLMSTKGTNQGISASSPRAKTPETNERSQAYKKRLPVFDLLYCGPRNAFTILSRKGPLLVHNCGYGGGENAMINMGALEQGLLREELKPMVDAWRDASPEIAGKRVTKTTRFGKNYEVREGGIWNILETAAKECLRTRSRQEAARCVFRYAGGKLVITLPNGRHLHYVHAKLERDSKNREQITYWGVDQKTKRWGKQTTWGGKLLENIVQAFSRDCLAVLMKKLRDKLYPQIMLVHDEDVMDIPKTFGSLDEVLGLMKEPIPWAPGLPLKGDGFRNDFYFKG